MQSEHSFLIQVTKALGCLESQISNWDVNYSYEWIEVSNIEVLLPSQGWKLHISSTVKAATQILEKVLPILLKEQACFKVTSTPSQLAAMNRGATDLSQVGKFITVYPINDSQAVRLATMLNDATTIFHGPRVPSDRPLRTNGVVYYRYGAFQPRWLQTPLGAVLPAIENIDGTMVPDFRGRVFRLPSWLQDPFEAAGIVDSNDGADLLVDERYLIGDVIANTSEVTVNLSVDIITGEIRILKRAKPGIEDAVLNRMRHEAAILREFNCLTAFPDLHDFIDNNKEHCLVMDYVPGLDLEKHVVEAATFGRYMPFPKIIKYLSLVAAALLCMHERGFCYGDLKPPHIFILPDGTVKLVDLESVSPCGEVSKTFVAGTPGYASPQRVEGQPLTIADDIYSFGALLYFLVTNADPSNAPDRQRLLNRPILAMNPDVPDNLVTLIHRCLDPRPEYRPLSMNVVAAMLTTSSLVQSITDFNLRSKTNFEPHDLSKKVALQLCRSAHSTDSDGLIWSFDVHGTDLRYHRDLELGNAGIVLALATITSEFDDPEFRYVLSKTAHSLDNSTPFHGAPLPGLYVGEAGIGAALLSAGLVLEDQRFVDSAIEKGRLVSALPHKSPDLFNGTAGRLRFHLFLWEVTRDEEHLRAAISCGKFILTAAEEINKDEIQWKIPEGYGIDNEQAYLGYAHGVAGIADALIDLYNVAPTNHLLKVIRASVSRLNNTATKVLGNDSGLDWPSEDGSGGKPGGGFWCHGSAGIARFLLRASNHHISPQAEKLAINAAKTAAVGVRWAGPSQCHGLAGNAEVLLDFFQSTGKQEYLDSALTLTKLAQTFLAETDNLEPSSPGALRTPGLMKGLSGLMVCLLRVGAPTRLPHILSIAAFQRLSELSSLGIQAKLKNMEPLNITKKVIVQPSPQLAQI